MTYQLYSIPGSGGMIVDAAFRLAEVPVGVILLKWDDTGWDSKVLQSVNPLGQVPILILPDGQIITESAAMLLHLGDLKPGSGLVPPANDPIRPQFLHWLIFLVSALYPTFTYGDVPDRWVAGNKDAAKLLRQETDEHRKVLLTYLESKVEGPWILGNRMTAVDLYFLTLRYWRPGLDWYAKHCPKLNDIGGRLEEIDVIDAMLKHYFPQEGTED